MRKLLYLLLVGIMILTLVAGCSPAAEPETPDTGEETEGETAAPAYPEREITFIVPWGAGGGSDRMARMIVDIIQENEFLPEPVVVVNKPGGSGAIGMNEAALNVGDPYTIIGVVSGQISAPLTTGSEVRASTFAPIAVMALDQNFLIAEANSPFDTVQDVVDYAKENPGKLTIGGTAVGAEDHMCSGLFEKTAGIETEYISFDGGGEVLSAVLGGHIDVAWANPAECISQYEGGLVKLLGVLSPERLDSFPDIPTFKEQGYDASFAQIRAISGSPDMPDYAVEVISEALKKVSETERWQKEYIEPNSLTNMWLTPEESKKHMDDAEKLYEEILTDLGLME